MDHSDGWHGYSSNRGGGRGWHGNRGNHGGGRRGWNKRGRRYYDNDTERKSQEEDGSRNYRRHKHERNDSSENTQNRERPPPGLRGREIGMWYAARSKRKQKQLDDQNSVLRIDSEQERGITKLLANIQSADKCLPQPSRSYRDPFDDQEEDYSHDKQPVKQGHFTKQTQDFKSHSGASQSYSSFKKRTQSNQYYDGQLHDDPSLPTSSSLFDNDDAECTSHSSLFDDSRKYSSSSSCNKSLQSASKSLFDDTPDCRSNSLPNAPSEMVDDYDLEDSDSDLDDEKLMEMTQELERNYLLGGSKAKGKDQFDPDQEDYEPGGSDSNSAEDSMTLGLYEIEDEVEESEFMFEFRRHNEDNKRSLERLNEIEVETCLSLQRNPGLDSKLQSDLQQKQRSSKFRQMEEFRKKLPSYNMKKEILKLVRNNQVVVISGETGCGKTTQVPQFILDDFIERGQGSLCRVVCTQPRRISAISVAERVAQERAEKCGESTVGYQIRLDSRLPNTQGSMLYCTTGIMLQWLASDKLLSKTTHIVLDEIHERDLHSDFLMIILKNLLTKRRDLKLILMSATLNAEQFSQYFFNCPMINIPGFTFPVKEYLLEDVVELVRFEPSSRNTGKPVGYGRNKAAERQDIENYKSWCNSLKRRYSPQTCQAMKLMTNFQLIDTDLCADLTEYIVRNTQEGAILIFLPGWSDIKQLNDKLESRTIFRNKAMFRIIPLHSLMPTVNQRQVFERPPQGVRKIVIATNIAETSITIDDVVYVIDCGKIKMKNFDAENNIQTLKPEWVSKANAKQRRGRAGRVQPGECYHLYSGYHADQLEDYQLPEILRTRLEELCLHIKLLKLGMVEPFVQKAMQPPSMVALKQSLQVLRDLNAIDPDEDLTPLGYHLAKMPVDPHSGKMLLYAAMFSCVDPIMTVAASLSFKDAFYVPMGKEKLADARKVELSDGTQSDHIMLVNAYQGWERASHRGTAWQYCRENFLSQQTLKMLHDMRKQFATILYDMKFLKNSDPKCPSANKNSGNIKLLKAIICSGLFPNVARIVSVKAKGADRPNKLRTKTDRSVYFHPKCVNSQETDFASQWVVYHLKMKVQQVCLFDSSVVSPLSLLLFGGEITVAEREQHQKNQDLNSHRVHIGDHVTLNTNRKTCELVSQLRQEFDKLLEYKVTHPGVTDWSPHSKEGVLMRAISELILTEKEERPYIRKVGGPKRNREDTAMCGYCGEKGHFSRRCKFKFK